MQGQILLSAVHRGTLFSYAGKTFVLLNGQAISRTTYPTLSTVWPSGAYGGGHTTTPMHMPNTAGLYLRGADFARGADPGSNSRTTLSGILPTASGVGSFQATALKSHSHVSGTQNGPYNSCMEGGGEGAERNITSSSQLGNGVVILSNTRPVTTNSSTDFDVDHTRVYMYICTS